MTDNRIQMERKFWDRFAGRYDRFVDRWIKSYPLLLERISLEIPMGSTVLEVASGTGLLALKMAEKAGRVYAVDISPAMVEQARKKAAARGLENVTFLVEDAYALPLESEVFDAAICSNALHNMKAPEIALSEMRRVLKEDGKLLTPTFCHGEGFKSRLLSMLMGFTGFPAYHRFTIEALANLIRDSGFSLIKREVIEDAIPMAFMVGKKR